MPGPRANEILRRLPSPQSFVAAEAHERRSGRPLRLRLGANESEFGPSPRAVEAMVRAASESSYYGDPDNHDLRDRLAERHGLQLDEVMVAAGADELLAMLVRCFIDPSDTGICAEGTYPMFAFHLRGFGARVVTIPYRDERVDVETMADAAREQGARLVYLANPDNPSGSQLSSVAVARLVAALPEDCLLILDEAYLEHGDADDVIPIEIDDTRVVRLRTFSKAYCLAGARVGYAFAHSSVLETLEKVRLNFGVNRIGQAGALTALEDHDHLRTVVEEVDAGRRHYAEIAAGLGLRALDSKANFVAIDTGSAPRARTLLEALAARDVFLRLPWAPPLDSCIRVTVAPRPQRLLFAELLEDALTAIS